MKNNQYKSILKTFIAFLKKNNVYKQYLYDLENGDEYRRRFGWPTEQVQFLIYHLENKPEDLILNAFRWADSDYPNWKKLFNEWDVILKKKKYEK
jgi:hypothetical protein